MIEAGYISGCRYFGDYRVIIANLCFLKRLAGEFGTNDGFIDKFIAYIKLTLCNERRHLCTCANAAGRAVNGMSKDNRILIICILRFRRTVNLNHCNSTYLRHCRMLYLHVGIHPFLNDVCLFNQRRKVFWTDINAEVIRVYEQSKISAIGNVEFNFTELGNIRFNITV